MEKFIVHGGKPLNGTISLAGAKNVALKLCVAAVLTDEEIMLRNVPDIRDMHGMMELLTHIGLTCSFTDNILRVRNSNRIATRIPLELGAKLRTSSLFMGPLLSRYGEAMIPNPGGCRIGARPIDRHIDALKIMGADISYNSDDGYFHAHAPELRGAEIPFGKNTHTGTEAVILSAVLASGRTVIRNAAEEVEIDDLISMLNSMGASVRRDTGRTIIIDGVPRLHGTEYTVMSDRNEEVTLAVLALASDGEITVRKSQAKNLGAFLSLLRQAGAAYTVLDDETTRYARSGRLKRTDVITLPHPGFMTDWQAPWALLMTQATGESTIHETVFESRFSYVSELVKMGAKIDFFNPSVPDPGNFYNFNWQDRKNGTYQAIRIRGPVKLHNAVLDMSDLRAGATLLIASLIAGGESILYGVDQIDRGYEAIDIRLGVLGADISRVKEDA